MSRAVCSDSAWVGFVVYEAVVLTHMWESLTRLVAKMIRRLTMTLYLTLVDRGKVTWVDL